MDARGTIDAVWRIESAKVIAALTRITRDVGAAEELAQDALLAALEQWPREGVPDNPGAWLTAVAKNRAFETMRRGQLLDRKHEEVGQLLRDKQDAQPLLDTRLDEDVGDDLLRLMLIACHPVLSTEARVALTLRLLGGLTTEEIARAFLVPEPTIAQRIVRAKKTLADAKAEFEVPRGEALAARLSPVLEAIYLVFNEGYAATAGDDWMRPQLCEDAMRLGRVLTSLLPQEPEVRGLVALMELQASRIPARTGPNGEPVLLLEQKRVNWDHTLIRHGLAELEKAEQLSPSPQRGSYTLQAALAACHARARTAEDTDWKRIAGLYDLLGAMTRSPVVELNRAVAHGMAFGPEAGLALVDAIEDPQMQRYHLFFSVRADLLIKLKRSAEAKVELERALELTHNAREQTLLRERIDKLEGDR
ncbi:MAG: RNA polymerase sigma factor [Myxococcaceae bacterium]